MLFRQMIHAIACRQIQNFFYHCSLFRCEILSLFDGISNVIINWNRTMFQILIWRIRFLIFLDKPVILYILTLSALVKYKSRPGCRLDVLQYPSLNLRLIPVFLPAGRHTHLPPFSDYGTCLRLRDSKFCLHYRNLYVYYNLPYTIRSFRQCPLLLLLHPVHWRGGVHATYDVLPSRRIWWNTYVRYIP